MKPSSTIVVCVIVRGLALQRSYNPVEVKSIYLAPAEKDIIAVADCVIDSHLPTVCAVCARPALQIVNPRAAGKIRGRQVCLQEPLHRRQDQLLRNLHTRRAPCLSAVGRGRNWVPSRIALEWIADEGSSPRGIRTSRIGVEDLVLLNRLRKVPVQFGISRDQGLVSIGL